MEKLNLSGTSTWQRLKGSEAFKNFSSFSPINEFYGLGKLT